MVTDLTPNFAPPCGHCFLDITIAFDIVLDMLTDALFHEALSHMDGVLDCFRGGAPVANNAGPIDPEEWCATIFRRVHPLADIVQGWTHQDGCQAAPWRIGQASLEGLAIHFG